MHHVANVHQANADAAFDGGRNVAIRKIQFRIVDGCLVGLDGALKLIRSRSLSVNLLLRNRPRFLQQSLKTLIIELCVAQLRLVTEEIGLGLGERYLVRARIYDGQQFTLGNVLTLTKIYLRELPVDSGADADGVESRDRSQAGQVHRDILLLRGGNADGNGLLAGGPGSARFAASTTAATERGKSQRNGQNRSQQIQNACNAHVF